jgi:hypothetical protein
LIISFPSATRLCRAHRKKIILQRQFSNLGIECFDIDGGARRFGPGFIAKNARRPLKELVFPLLDLIGVHIELLDNSTSVCSPLTAASATFALKAGL